MDIENSRLTQHEYRALAHFGERITPKLIVVHYTAGGSLDSSYRALDNAGLSAHILLGRDGELVQLVDFNRRAFHAGQSSWRGLGSLNSHSIGIEVCNYGWLLPRGDGNFVRAGQTPVFGPEEVIVATHKNGSPRQAGWEIYPAEQLEVLRALCRRLLDEYPSIREIVGHDDISPGRKQDPGPAMPMASLQLLTERGGINDGFRTYEVTARNGLRLRGGPGTEHDTVGVLRFGQRVRVINDEALWYQVDLQGNGVTDGFSHSGFMRVA